MFCKKLKYHAESLNNLTCGWEIIFLKINHRLQTLTKIPPIYEQKFLSDEKKFISFFFATYIQSALART